ncbi:MAG TPA: hypothetical protein VFI61_02580 [Patescibacteria group bacterium]|nr:hypothetical protein [Patescibacteria group bacterium]
MRPAKRRIIRAKNKEKGRKHGLIFKLLIPIAIVLFFILFVKISTRYWNGKDKVAFVFRQNGGASVGVTVLDPTLNEIVTMTIPGETQVEVAKNYGTLRLKNVWQLSFNEKLKGDLLAETVTQNFLFPIKLWSEEDAQNLSKSNIAGIVKFIFLPIKTNISLGDRLSISLFALRVPKLNRTEIDLGKSQFLHKEKLSDGQVGYVLTGRISERLSIYFTDTDFSQSGATIYITDATNKFGIAQKVGEIVEVMGGKVVSIDKKDELKDTDCTVSGKNSKIVKKTAMFFGCTQKSTVSNFDLEITLGSKFAKRF